MNDQNSLKLFDRAQKVLVGGVNSPVRAFNAVGGSPLVMSRAQGAVLYDADHNAFTDYCLSWGALILGHADKTVRVAVKKTVERGSSFGTTTRQEIELAEHIVQRIPSIESIRFVNSGTEGTMSAIRLARGYTGKDVVIKFDGCYHGHVDALLTHAGSGVAELKESSSSGVPQGHIADTISLPYNDTGRVTQVIQEHAQRIACVIIEPVAGNMGVIPATREFLQTLRALTQQHNIVLIFDEVMTGFRSPANSVQAEMNIEPDLTCLGKIIGGGFPVGAYGGRQDIMDCLAPKGSVYQAGTFSGNPVIMKAGLATLRRLNENFYKRLIQKCSAFVEQINAFFQENHIDAHMVQYASMMSLRFRAEPVMNYDDAKSACGGELYQQLFWHLLKDGIYWPPAELETFFVSGRHSRKDLNHLSGSIQRFFSERMG